ncbi:hypothetical protein ACFRNT_20245 [Streptomyces sp. NPDC056697]|uniref:hypothetical protein n=1 Tax=Streptomyces sp. NPDC056697 TaxID=3345915 RepID=UPI0036BE5B47
MLLAVGAAERWADDGITANAVMPGGIRTGLQRHQEGNTTPEVEEAFANFTWKTVEEGAATSVLVAASPCSKASPVATSRTATRRNSTPTPTPMPTAACARTHSTRTTPSGSGTWAPRCSAPETLCTSGLGEVVGAGDDASPAPGPRPPAPGPRPPHGIEHIACGEPRPGRNPKEP